MSWSHKLMSSLDQRSEIIGTSRGDVQLARTGTGPPVLAIHGGPGGFDQGLAWCHHLRAGGCEVIAPSRPGYLRTPLSSGRSPQSQADLYAATLDALDVDRVAVLGFSSGGPSAVHFAARHHDRTTALMLDTAILLPFQPALSRVRRATYESSLAVWLSYQLVHTKPELMTRWMLGGVSAGLSAEQKEAEEHWITSDPTRLRSLRQQFASIAPKKHRHTGWVNDLANEHSLAPLPFSEVITPTLIAQGVNDAVIPLEHATTAADRIAGAELVLVAQGHHILSLSRNYGPVASRQLELVHG